MRRVAAPYNVNNHKLLPKPRADNIHPYTVQYTLGTVFLRTNKVRPHGVPLAAALQIPIYQSVYTTKVPADITVGTFLFYEYSVKRQRDFFQFIPALPTASKSRCISLFKAAFSGNESSGSRATISFAACCVSSSVPLSFSISAIFISGRPC